MPALWACHCRAGYVYRDWRTVWRPRTPDDSKRPTDSSSGWCRDFWDTLGARTGTCGGQNMKPRHIIFAGLVIFTTLIVWTWASRNRFASSADRLLLLLPDGTSFSDPKVTVWLDAASEEGLHVVPVHDSELVRPFFPTTQCAGMILPDSIHPTASDVFLTAIHSFVASGGKLMLV